MQASRMTPAPMRVDALDSPRVEVRAERKLVAMAPVAAKSGNDFDHEDEDCERGEPKVEIRTVHDDVYPFRSADRAIQPGRRRRAFRCDRVQSCRQAPVPSPRRTCARDWTRDLDFTQEARATSMCEVGPTGTEYRHDRSCPLPVIASTVDGTQAGGWPVGARRGGSVARLPRRLPLTHTRTGERMSPSPVRFRASVSAYSSNEDGNSMTSSTSQLSPSCSKMT